MQLFFNWCHTIFFRKPRSSFWVPTALAMKPDNWISLLLWIYSILTKKTYFTPFVTKSFKSNPVILFLLLLRRGVFLFHLKSYNPNFDMVYFRSWLDFSGLNSLWLWRKFDTTELQNENDYFGKYVWERDLFGGGGVEVASLNIFVGIYMTRNTAL